MPRTASTSRSSRILAGLGALAVLVLIAALPMLLLWAAGNPLPAVGDWLATLAGDPAAALEQLWQALTSRDDGDLFVQVLTVVGWVAAALAGWGWLTFLVAVVVETAAQLPARRRGRVPRQSARIPGMRLQQRAAAALVAAIIGVFAAPALASAGVPAAQPAVAAPVHPGTQPAITTTVATPATSTAPVTTYLQHPVARGEGLLDVAERYGLPWQTLAEANHGQPQPDGRSLQPGSTRIYAGWVLRVPITTTSAAVVTPVANTTVTQTPGAAAPVYQVARGDWLAGVAERFLGDPNRYPEIAALNPHLEQRDVRFPDHIEQGWRITLPADAHDRGPSGHARGAIVAGATAEPPAAPGSGGPGAGPGQNPGAGPGQSPGAATPAPSTPPSTAPAPSASPSGAPASSSAPAPSASATAVSPAGSAVPSAVPGTAAPSTTAAPPTAAPPAAAPPADSGEDPVDEAVVIGTLAGAGLLSALLLTAVLHRRRRQRQHRRPGRRLPHPRGGATERALRVAEAPADVDRLDLALRVLAAGLADREAPLPDIQAAWIIGQKVTVVLTEPCPDPPAPWVPDGPHWTLPGDAPLPAVDEQLAPLPTLVTVGSQPGRHLLLDLERLGSLTITGDPEHSLALLRYLASELACNNWSDDVEVIVAGLPVQQTELLVALNPDRVRAVSSVPEAAARLRRRIGAVTGALEVSGVDSTFAGRLTDLGEAWTPQVLLVADPDGDDLAALADLTAQLQAAGGCAVAIAMTAPADAGLAGPTATVTADGGLHLDLPGLRTQAAAAGLPVAELEPLAEIMTQARSTADEPTPPAPEPEPWAAETDAAGAVLNLFDTPAPDPDADDPHNTVGGRPVVDDDWTEPSRPSVPQAPQPAPVDPITAIPEVVAATTAPRREVTAAIRQRRRRTDPELDADLRAWRDQDRTRPRIGILGPVTVEAPGPVPDQRRRFHAEIIVYLAQRGSRGATGDRLSEALWPDQQVKDASRRVAITRARRWLGDTAAGSPWLPEMGPDRIYRLESGYLLDWHLFRRLRTRGESHGPAGVRDLRAALDLVRGVPLDGADRAYAAGARNPFTWLPESDIYPGHLTSAVVDTAHELAELYLDAGDSDGARWAVQRAWLADPHRGDDAPWRDLMRAAHADGHTAELRNLLGELMRARQAEVPEDLTPDTYAWLLPLLPDLLGASTPIG